MKKRILVTIVALTLASVALSGCTFAGGEDGQLTLAASGQGHDDVESLFVSFSEVAVRKSDGSSQNVGTAWFGALQSPGNGTDENETDRGTGDNETGDGNTTDGNGTDGNETAEEKVTICHVPPGNPDNEHTIEIGESAVDAHMAHGDRMGPCEGGDNETAGELDTGDDDIIVIVDQTIEVDLLAEGDAATIADQVDVEEGDFDQIVLRVESARAILRDGTEVRVTIETEIVVIERQFRVVEDDVTRVEVEFDLGQGLSEADTAQDPDQDFPPGDGGDVTVNIQFSLTLIVQNVIIIEGTPDTGGGTGGDGTGGDGGDTIITVENNVNVLIRSTEVQVENVESVFVRISQVILVLECPPQEEPTESPAADNNTGGNDTGNTTGDETDGNTTTGSTECPGVTIEVEDTEIDLLDFTSADSFAVLGLDEVDAGQVTQIHLRLSSATVVESDGDTADVTIVQEEATAPASFEVSGDEITQVTLLFDLQTSLTVDDDGQWTLSPTIAEVDASETDEPAEEDQPDSDTEDDGTGGGDNETAENETG